MLNKNTRLKKEIGRRFKQFRQAIKKSQQKLAHELKVCQTTISSIEMGKSFPRIGIQNYLNIHYHLNLNWLLTGQGEMIIPLGKDSKTADSPQIDDSDSRVDPYEELFTLMRIPFIEQIILAKLAEVKIIAEEEIKAFFEET
jgi:transcriptional regulator with XRE-family HTH domain